MDFQCPLWIILRTLFPFGLFGIVTLLLIYLFMHLSVCTLNVHGLRDRAKRRNFISWLGAFAFDIMLLKETYLTANDFARSGLNGGGSCFCHLRPPPTLVGSLLFVPLPFVVSSHNLVMILRGGLSQSFVSFQISHYVCVMCMHRASPRHAFLSLMISFPLFVGIPLPLLAVSLIVLCLLVIGQVSPQILRA